MVFRPRALRERTRVHGAQGDELTDDFPSGLRALRVETATLPTRGFRSHALALLKSKLGSEEPVPRQAATRHLRPRGSPRR